MSVPRSSKLPKITSPGKESVNIKLNTKFGRTNNLSNMKDRLN
jgi:hypothetical protein